MPTYEVELSDGRIVDVEGDKEPSESDVMGLLSPKAPVPQLPPPGQRPFPENPDLNEPSSGFEPGAYIPPGEKPPSLFQSFVPLPEPFQGKSLLGQAAAAGANFGIQTAGGMASPGGLMALPLGLLGKVGAVAAGAGFGVPAVKQGLERVYQGAALEQPQEVMEGGLQALTGGLITIGAAKALPRAAAELTKTLKGSPDAQAVRSDTGLADEAGKAQKGSTTDSGSNVQQAASGAPNAPGQETQVGVTPEVPLSEAPPSAVTGEANRTEAGESGAVEPPVVAGGTPQAMAEGGTPAETPQGGNVTPTVTEPSGPQMGAAGVEELPPTGTGLKNVIGDNEREALGLHDAPETVVRNMEKAWNESGQVEAANPGAGKALSDSLIADPERNLTDADSALLLRHKTDLFNKLNDAAERSHVGDDASKAAAQVEHDKLLIDYGQLLDAVKKRGAEWGREGRWRQAMAKEDFSFTSTDELNRYHRTLTGEDLPGKKVEQADRISKGVKEAQTVADKATAAVQQELKKKSYIPTSPDMSAAEKRAFDAANKVVREWAVRRADQATLDRIKEVKTKQEVYQIQKDAIDRAEAAIHKQAREAAIARAKAETQARVAKTVRDREVAKIQEKAAKKAQDAVDALHRRNLLDLIKVQRELRDNPIKSVWTKVREQIDKGEGNFDDIRNRVAVELGMKVKRVTQIMAQDERTKYLMNEAWAAQQKAGRLRQEAKRWVAGADTPEGVKLLTGLPRILFGLKTFGHGTVPLGTHAPFVAFQPTYWGKYFSAYKTMYKMVASKAFYQQQVSDLIRRPNFIEARRSGLVNDPSVYEDYTNPEITKFITGGQVGNRGFTVLKILRQDMFDQRWNKLPKSLQVPEVAKAISDAVNHDTGVIKAMAPKGYGLALFAPRLEASRVMSLLGDPGKAGTIFAKQLWTRATPAERAFAIHQVQSKAMIAGTLYALLKANQGILNAVGSKQKVNTDDPMKSDFLKFKAAGMDFAYGNAMLSMMRMPMSLYRIVSTDGGKTKNLVYSDESAYTVLGRFTRSQLSPFMGTLTDLGLGADFESRPLPRTAFGALPQNRPVPKRLREQGVKPYSYKEYLSEQLSPIPGQEAIKEAWKHGLGMTDEQIKGLERAVAITTIMAATGGRLTADWNLNKKPESIYK